MIRNICGLRYRYLHENEFTEVELSKSAGTLKISDEDTDAGMLYNYTVSARLRQKAFYTQGMPVLAELKLSDGTRLQIGNEHFPAFIKMQEDTEIATLEIEWKDIEHPKFYTI